MEYTSAIHFGLVDLRHFAFVGTKAKCLKYFNSYDVQVYVVRILN